jgi:predicted nucleic-acid-binding protein
MRSVDTNLLARFILADDPSQHAIASEILQEPIWVTPTVWLELGWLLDKKLKLQRQAVADAITILLSIESLRTQNPDRLYWAVERYRSGADWGDAIHLVMSEDIADSFTTFDRGIVGKIGDQSPLPIETLS